MDFCLKIAPTEHGETADELFEVEDPHLLVVKHIKHPLSDDARKREVFEERLSIDRVIGAPLCKIFKDATQYDPLVVREDLASIPKSDTKRAALRRNADFGVVRQAKRTVKNNTHRTLAAHAR